MHPLVRDGDILLVQPIDADLVRLGDLVFFENRHGRIVVHRVVRRLWEDGKLFFQIKGDRVARSDGMIPEARVFGRIASIERDGRSTSTSRPAFRFLSMVMALISPRNLDRGSIAPLMKFVAQRAPVFSKYLV